MAHGGAAVGRLEPAPDDADPDERTWFVEGALPGELVQAEIVKSKRRWVRGQAVEIVEPSAARIEPACVLADRCGGCSWQHVDPAAQAELKRSVVADQLRKLPLRVGEVVPSPRALGYRRRARMHYERVDDTFAMGFHRVRSRDLIDVQSCPVLEPALDEGLALVRELADVLPPRGEVHALTDGTRVVFGFPGVRPLNEVVRETTAWIERHARVAGAVLRGGRTRHGIGDTELAVDGGGDLHPVLLGPFSFSQAQSAVNRRLVEHVLRAANAGGQRVLELYAGAGNFTRGLARVAKRVRAVDAGRDEMHALRQMLSSTKLRADAKRGSVDRLLPAWAAADKVYDVVVLDPPRGGLGIPSARALAKVAIERIVYVSCDPATLARDLEAILAVDRRWSITDVRVFDMMPMTSEVEVVTVVEKRAP
jgi:23S rRNA (uracil1939-C5)-methyltransferase